MKCDRCGAEESFFWYRIGWGCDSEGDKGVVMTLCLKCCISFDAWYREGKE